jgi:hypothetical protein
MFRAFICSSSGVQVVTTALVTVRENKVLVIGLCCSVCRVVIGVGYVVGYIGIRCYVSSSLEWVALWGEVGVWCGIECVMHVGCRLPMVVCSLEGLDRNLRRLWKLAIVQRKQQNITKALLHPW